MFDLFNFFFLILITKQHKMSSSNYSDAEAMRFSVGGKDTQKSKSHVINK